MINSDMFIFDYLLSIRRHDKMNVSEDTAFGLRSRPDRECRPPAPRPRVYPAAEFLSSDLLILKIRVNCRDNCSRNDWSDNKQEGKLATKYPE